ncbi:hypothetical protein DN752_17735 [Echinicola strongylocentroti]|uniref:Photosynthesis system II assembly factor Ycf48/Hcf136-like domain-containing protein n=1 Tax=Echinicola strongylocentroti TaxID=1795355 RepID=A0A2Z4IN67_9BACT|nr:hypothetical protein [Echinicola strongylocentroti]AWW31823.1 hypothetical protein DN752_17735 [Echinicola strongylocentroti]
MSIRLGNTVITQIGKIKAGSSNVKKVMAGSTQIWPVGILTWVNVPTGSSFDILGVDADQDTDIVLVGQNAISRSFNSGSSWTGQAPGLNIYTDVIHFGTGYFYAPATSGNLFYTTTTTGSWTTATGSFGSLNGITYRVSSNGFYAVGDNGTIAVSDGLNSWGDYDRVNTSNDLHAISTEIIVCGNGGVILNLYFDIDGPYWALESTPTSSNLFGIYSRTTGTIRHVAVGNNGTIITSGNGTSWTSRSSPTSENLRDVIYSDYHSLWLACGENGTIIQSGDGINWSIEPSGVSDHLLSLAKFGNYILAAGANGRLIKGI